MDKKNKIYVAGHRGLVGSALCRRLQREGYTNILTRERRDLDLTRQAEVEAFFEKERPDYVFLAAARVGGILDNSTYMADFIYQNLLIAANTIEASYKFGVKKLLNLGSTCIYPRLAPQPLKEEYFLSGCLEPTNEAYAVAKIAAIKLCRYYNKQYGTNFISVMPTNLYGINDNYNFEGSHLLPAFIRKFHLAKLLRKKDIDAIKAEFAKFGAPRGYGEGDDVIGALKGLGITADALALWGSGTAYRELLYSDDQAEADVFLMENYDAAKIGEFVNIGTGEDLQIKEIAELVRDVVGFEGDVVWDTTKPDGMPKKLTDVSRINALGWKAKTNLRDGIVLTYGDYCK
ncbi:MAG TPA: GDP-L-fucose synthase [Candidatus Omnitrophota bacterium]|nr:GDP-L-fucose synthase [Candidatus Omnitrophota bacterium]HPS36515.1 GDP-L-fucose synthase [Candidatus Omnitrophota bacterium]